MKPIVFAIEDDEALRDAYTYSLENEFDFRCFASGESFFNALKKQSIMPDIILLDVMLPGEDGFAILSRFRSNDDTAGIPVIMASAKDEEVSKVKGLNMGANDYITKPFGVMELIARIKAHLRNAPKKADPESITYKDIVVDSTKHEITVNGTVLKTTRKEYNLLRLLCKNAEQLQEREVIFEKVWGEDFIGESRTLDTHIREVRKMLTEAESSATIKVIRGVGYILV